MDGDRALLRVRRWMPRTVRVSMLAFLAGMFLACAVMLQPLIASPTLRVVGLTMAVWMAVQLMGSIFALLLDFVTRAVLTPSHLRVHRGLWTDDIALEAVTDVSVVEVNRWLPASSLAGMLFRRERDYLDWGDGDALRVSWRDERGRARRIWVRMHEAHAFLLRIEAQRRGAATGVRVEDAATNVGEETEAHTEATSRARRA
jgi:hypothetical protein